ATACSVSNAWQSRHAHPSATSANGVSAPSRNTAHSPATSSGNGADRSTTHADHASDASATATCHPGPSGGGQPDPSGGGDTANRYASERWSSVSVSANTSGT